jgi:hypothetical protein
MKRRIARLSMLLVFALGLGAPPAHASHQLRAAMRQLWDDHVSLTRQFIVSTLGDLPDRKVTIDRLLQNQDDIGDAIKPFYGDAAGEELSKLLRGHIVIAAVIVGQAKDGLHAKLEDSKRKWSTNGDEIATFLSNANPGYWPAPAMKQMMQDHLALTTVELEARLRGDSRAEAVAYQQVHAQAMMMADMLTDGIARQFPGKVR